MKNSAVVLVGGKSSHGGQNEASHGVERRRFLTNRVKRSGTFDEVFLSAASFSDYANFGLPVMPAAFRTSIMRDGGRTGLIIRLINEFISKSCLMVSFYKRNFR